MRIYLSNPTTEVEHRSPGQGADQPTDAQIIGPVITTEEVADAHIGEVIC